MDLLTIIDNKKILEDIRPMLVVDNSIMIAFADQVIETYIEQHGFDPMFIMHVEDRVNTELSFRN